ncbi:MAG: hypothetical protein HRU71_14565 [Planctomycetia bacterium]|nr:MAG: hypothetical protein HRU71_14565 [Planctomycetia bacterium]
MNSRPESAARTADRARSLLCTSWPYLRTPLRIYLMVMLPICVLQGFLLINPTPRWMKATAGLVVLLTVHGLIRGYVRRLVLSPKGARFVTLTRTITLPWDGIKKYGVYIPGGGLGAVEYFYLTTHDRPPEGKWEIDENTIQIQARDGLLEIVEALRTADRTQAGESTAG